MIQANITYYSDAYRNAACPSVSIVVNAIRRLPKRWQSSAGTTSNDSGAKHIVLSARRRFQHRGNYNYTHPIFCSHLLPIFTPECSRLWILVCHSCLSGIFLSETTPLIPFKRGGLKKDSEQSRMTK